MRRMIALLPVGLLLGGLLGLPAPAAAQEGRPVEEVEEARANTVVFLVRHAETQPDGTRDPGLSAEGRDRAERLAVALADAGLEVVYTTDYARTRGTAAVVADRLGEPARIYDPARLQTFAEALRSRGGRMLVVGHSNTTPDLVRVLGGDPGAPIHEAEHDRLYILFLEEESARTVMIRY